jgi:hypothetical protein
MMPVQPRSFPDRAQAGYYAFTAFVGGLIRNTSFLMLLFCFGFAAAAAAVGAAAYFWRHPEVRSFVEALEADLPDTNPSAVVPNTQLPSHIKDPTKVQRDENRERRKLAAEKRRSKSFRRQY